MEGEKEGRNEEKEKQAASKHFLDPRSCLSHGPGKKKKDNRECAGLLIQAFPRAHFMCVYSFPLQCVSVIPHNVITGCVRMLSY